LKEKFKRYAHLQINTKRYSRKTRLALPPTKFVLEITRQYHKQDAMAVPAPTVVSKGTNKSLIQESESMGWAVSDATTKAIIKGLCRNEIIHKVMFLSEEILKAQGKAAMKIRKALNYRNDSTGDGFWASTCATAIKESIHGKQNSMITNMGSNIKKIRECVHLNTSLCK
jgi:hypothetical protein